MIFNEFLEWRKTRKRFQQYVSPEDIERVMKRVGSPEPQLKHFQFVVILIDDKRPEEVASITSTVATTIFKHSAILSCMNPSMVVALLGAPFPENNSPEARRALVDALIQVTGSRIRIAHGECDGLVGVFGNCGYGALIPGFNRMLKQLLESELGAAIDFA